MSFSFLSQRAQALQPSATLGFANLVKKMVRDGADIVQLTVGEPHLMPMLRVIFAFIFKLFDPAVYKYSGEAGLEMLRNEMLRHFKKFGIVADLAQIMITHGVKGGLMILFASLVDPPTEDAPGTPVLIFAPRGGGPWPTYAEQVKMFGGVPQLIYTRASDGYRANPEDLRGWCTRLNGRKGLVLLVPPGNPDTAVYSRAQLKQLVDVALEFPNVFVLSDEIYGELRYDGEDYVSLWEFEALRPQMAVLGGPSKPMCIPGLRIGMIIAQDWLMSKLVANQGQLLSHPSNLAQVFAYCSYRYGTGITAKLKKIFAANQQRVVEAFTDAGLADLIPVKPQGALYVYLDVQRLIGRCFAGSSQVKSAAELRDHLLDKGKVAVTSFGQHGIRLSIAIAPKRLEEGLLRILKILASSSEEMITVAEGLAPAHAAFKVA